MRLSMISRIIKDEVGVIHRSRRHSRPKNKEQYKWITRKFHAKLIRTTFLFNVLSMQQSEQLNENNEPFKLMKINISSTTYGVLFVASAYIEQL